MSGIRPEQLQARQVLAEVLSDLGRDDPEVDWLDYYYDGRHSVAFSTDVRIDGKNRPVVVRIPKSGGSDEHPVKLQLAHEVRRRLADRDLVPFDVPEPLGTSPTEFGLGIVDRPETDTALKDLEYDVDPVAITAQVAVGLHRLDASAFRDLVDGPATRREHAESALEVFEHYDCNNFRFARKWCENHLPDETPASLLHGSLRGENILVSLPYGAPNNAGPDDVSISVVDWESVTIGDPAHEVAMISRGHRKAFKARGQKISTLVGHYNNRAETHIRLQHVRFWEVWLRATLFLQAYEEEGMSGHAEHMMTVLESVLRRC